MAIDLDFENLSADEVEQSQVRLGAQIEEEVPGVKANKGVLHDLVIGMMGMILAGLEKAAGVQLRSASLAAVIEDPEAADPATVDALASNYNLSRSAAIQAEGTVRVVVTSPLPINLPTNIGFTSVGRRYATQTSYAIRPPGSALITTTDRALTSIGQGRYVFTVDVLADDAGISPVKANDVLTPDATIANFVSAFADSDFSGGRSAESNAEILAKIPIAMAGKAAAGANGIANLIMSEFPDVLAVSVIGYGDEEMRRHHALFPGGSGSRYDIYVKTALLPIVTAVTRTATLMTNAGDSGVWQCGLGKDLAPGWYDVLSVLPADQDPATNVGVEPTTEVRAADATGDGFVPDLLTGEEAAYTPFQTASITFPDVIGTIGATADYVVRLRHMPLLRDVQDFVGGGGVRPKGSDIVVRAPVPCDVSIDMLITAPVGSSVDTGVIGQAVADWVNRLGFVGRLPATAIASSIADRLPAGAMVSRTWVYGTIRQPDQTIVSAGGPHELIVPNTPEYGVTTNTVSFLADPVDINVVVQNA
jgi:hypothetical protein